MKINQDNCRKIVTNELFIKSKMKKAFEDERREEIYSKYF